MKSCQEQKESPACLLAREQQSTSLFHNYRHTTFHYKRKWQIRQVLQKNVTPLCTPIFDPIIFCFSPAFTEQLTGFPAPRDQWKQAIPKSLKQQCQLAFSKPIVGSSATQLPLILMRAGKRSPLVTVENIQPQRASQEFKSTDKSMTLTNASHDTTCTHAPQNQLGYSLRSGSSAILIQIPVWQAMGRAGEVQRICQLQQTRTSCTWAACWVGLRGRQTGRLIRFFNHSIQK